MAKITHYDIGDRWTPQATWTVASVATDPSQIVVRLQDPTGTESVVTTASSPSSLTSASTPLARMSQGVYQLKPGVSLTAAGYWYVRFEGTGTAEASEEFLTIVDPSEFTSDAGLSTRALVGLAETKDWLQQQNVDTGEDLDLARVINDVSDRIHYEAGREFKPITAGSVTRTFPVTDYCSTIYVGDLNVLSTSSPMSVLAYDGVTTIKTFATADLVTYPLVKQAWEPIRKIQIRSTAYTGLMPGQWITVTGTWGFPSVPGNIRQAALDAIAAIMDRDAEHYRQDLGTVTPGGEAGNVVVLQQSQPMFLSLPPSAFAVARSYKDQLLG